MKRKRKAVRASPAWVRRVVLAAALLAVAFFPVYGAASGQQAAACRGCRAQPANAERWAIRLPGQWAAGDGVTGTVPVSGQAYVAVGGDVVAVGSGLTITGYGISHGSQLWQVTLPGEAGSAIMSVRAWPGVVTAGIAGPHGRTRTEVVLDSATGTVLRRYPAAVFGGAVLASAATTVIVGPDSVTSYNNRDGKIRWQRRIGAGQAWRADGGTLYVAESAGGYLGSAPVTELRVIDLNSGTERTLGSPLGLPFSGTLSVAADGVVLFTSAAGVTAYSSSTGGMLWSMAGAVPEGADPSAPLVYLTSAAGALVGVDPLTGAVKAAVSGSTAGGSAGMYVVRGGVALGLDSGADGEAWGYDLAAGRVTWTAPGLPWPHYFSDLSGLGGSAALTSDIVVVAACAQLAAASTATASPSTTASPASTASAAASASPAASRSAAARGSSAARRSRAGTASKGAASLAATVSPAVSASSGATGPDSAASASPTASPVPTSTPSPSPTATPSASPAPVYLCAEPELVALNV